MILVADLPARKLLRAWQEAVAIVQELADTVGRAGPAAKVPNLEHVALGLDGDLVILPGSPPPDHAARQLAQTLQVLINGTGAPPELRRLVTENTGDTPTHASVEEFARALAIFERPGRQADIAGVVARDPSAQADSKMDSELERLRARAREAAETRSKQDRSARTRPRRRWWRAPVAACVLVLVGATTLPAALWLRSDPRGVATSSALRTLVSRTGDRLGRMVRSGVNAVIASRETLPAPELNESPQPAAQSAPTSVAERRWADAPRTAPPSDSLGEPAVQTGAQTGAPRALVLSPIEDAQGAIEARGGEGEPDSVPRELGGAPVIYAPAVPVIYTPADAEVIPAVMLRPYIPSTGPHPAPAETGVLEIVVSETGIVERVRLISTANRFQERMLVAAAKAWKFRPALKDGQPVKYRITVRVTL